MSTNQPIEPSVSPTEDERLWGLLSHLSALAIFLVWGLGQILGPLIIWFIKKDQSPFVADQAKEALNFQISFTIYMLGISVLFGIGKILAFTIILIPVSFIIWVVAGILAGIMAIAWLVYVITAGLQANQRIAYRYPFNLRLVK